MTRKLPQVSKKNALEAAHAVRTLFKGAKSYSDIDQSYTHIDSFTDFLVWPAQGLETIVSQGSLREYACLFYTALRNSGELPPIVGSSISRACSEILKNSQIFDNIKYYPDGSFIGSWDESKRKFGEYLKEVIVPKLAEENPGYLFMMTKLMETLNKRGESPIASGFIATVVYRAMEIELESIEKSNGN
ncbi:MAG: hypothetical protein AABY07_08290 [Nanoarchaeota archaeon]